MITQLFLESKIAGYFVEHIHESIGVHALAAKLRKKPDDVSKVLTKMANSGVLLSIPRSGITVFFLNTRHPSIAPAVKRLAASEKLMTLRNHLFPLEGIEYVIRYGSSDEHHDSISPLNLLIVGDIDKFALHAALGLAENELNQPIHCLPMTAIEHDSRMRKNDSTLNAIYAGKYECILNFVVE